MLDSLLGYFRAYRRWRKGYWQLWAMQGRLPSSRRWYRLPKFVFEHDVPRGAAAIAYHETYF